MSSGKPKESADVEMTIPPETGSPDVEMQVGVTAALPPAPDEDPDALHPIAILMDELKHVDISIRLHAVKKVSTIALALGIERTRAELIPFLKDAVLDEEDEILLALAEELGSAYFVTFVGGTEHAHVLFGPLECLCGTEEPIVRNKAVESLVKIMSAMEPSHIQAHFMPVQERLAKHPWFTNRIAAAALSPFLLERLAAASQDTLINAYVHLIQDDTPMVRRAAATHLTDIIGHTSKEVSMEELYPAFLQIVQDEQDSVRLLSVKILIAFAGECSAPERAELLVPVYKNLASDRSWRVRYMVAEHFASLIRGLKDDAQIEEFVLAFVALLKDTEAEVRTAATTQLYDVCSLCLAAQITALILPVLKELVNDTSSYVRASLALHVRDLPAIVGKESSVEHIMPILILLLRDECSDVRLNIISKIEKINEVVGIQLLSQSLLPAIVDLAGDRHWRVRLAIIDHTPLLASQLVNDASQPAHLDIDLGIDFFNESLCELTLSLLTDKVFAVREAAIASLTKLTRVFGTPWALHHVIPKIIEKATSDNYLYRLTTIFAIKAFIELVDLNAICSLFLPTLLLLSKDPVPNVRFNVAKALEVLIKKLSVSAPENASAQSASVLKQNIEPVLNTLFQDKDNDVKFFAKTPCY